MQSSPGGDLRTASARSGLGLAARRLGAIGLLMAVGIALSGCGGNCQAGGNKSGGGVLCNALKF